MPPHDPRDEDLRLQMIAHTESPGHLNNALDDVFGSDDESPNVDPDRYAEVRDSHPSDVRRLQTEHVTAGYREGITAAKAKSIQAGFDEGFGLGATIGLKAGQMLGLLEGIASALRAENVDTAYQAQCLLEDARKELSTEMIYDEKYWAPDGTWKYEIGSVAAESDIIFEDVASAHPLISKWDHAIDEQIKKWGIDMLILNQLDETTVAVVSEKKEVKVEQQPREKLDW